MIARGNIPNLLTFARVAAVPVCLLFMLLAPACTSTLLWIFVAASLTDFLDGYLARKWNVVSTLGALLDPIADKLLVALMLLYLVSEKSSPNLVMPAQAGIQSALLLPVAIILLRELYISGLREFLAKRGAELPVSQGGKWKTAMQMIAITALLAAPVAASATLSSIGTALLYVAAFLATTSAISYTRASWKHLR